MSPQIVGFFSNREAAERAKHELIHAGFGHSDISILSGADGAGFWQEVKDFFGLADESEQQIYADAGREMIAVAVSVNVSDANAASEADAIQIMQRNKPINLDRRSDEQVVEATATAEEAVMMTGARTVEKLS